MDDAELVELLDEARTARALASRRGRRVLGRAASDAGTLAGALVDLAEAGATAVVRTSAGTTAAGLVVGVGRDVVVVGDRWVRLDAVTVVRPGAAPPTPGGAPDGDRPGRGATLLELLGGLVDDGPWLQLTVVGGERLSGRIVAVGSDVVTIAADGPGGPAYVSADSIVEVLRSG
ncbi:MAG: hypothetical protein JF603_09780 [Acidobacteria bacterium]|nr:hypothetical protein [Acidobacteriota bacterium]